MVWSKWKAAALVAGLVCAGVTCSGWVYSQQALSQPLPGGVNPSEIVVVNEPGKPPQHCVLQKTVRLANGQTAVEVRNMASGEVTTLIMMDNAPGVSGTTDSQIKPTSGAWSPASATQPQPTVEDASKVTTRYQPMPSGAPLPGQAATPISASAQMRTVNLPDKQAVKCRVMAEWKTPDGHNAAQLQAIEGGEIMTMVEIAAASGNGSVTASLYRWGHSTTPPQGVPVPPLGQTVSTVVNPPMQTYMPRENYGPTPTSQKPSLGDYLKKGFGGLFGGSNKPGPMVQSAPEPTFRPDSTNFLEAPKRTELAKAPFVVNEGDKINANDSVKTTEKPLFQEMPKSFDAPKMQDVPKIVDKGKPSNGPSPFQAAKPLETPRVTEIPKSFDIPKTPATHPIPDVPKAVTTVPAPPAGDYKAQWSPTDSKAPGFGKPTADSTLPTNTKPAIPPLPSVAPSPPTALPAAPAPVTPLNNVPALPPLPSVQPGPAILPSTPLPVMPPPVAPSAAVPASPGVKATPPVAPAAPAVPALPAPAAPAPVNTAPALPAPADSPLTPIGAWKKSDPLDSPEAFLPRRAEDKMVAVPTPAPIQTPTPAMPGTAHVSDNARPALGSGSAMAASNSGSPQYLPATLPQAKAPMAPAFPTPKMPEPVDAAGFTNAFTTPAPAQDQQQQLPSGNPAMMKGNGYGPTPMMYNGPMPPNPVMPAQGYGMPTIPYGNGMPMMPMQPMMPYANPAMDRPGVPVSAVMSMQQCIGILQSSIYPSQRESAVYQLSACEWRTNPQIVQLLLMSAKQDPAPMVRAAAVGSLARMGVAAEVVQTTFNQLKNDADPRVRQEAEQALVRCTPGSGLQAAGGR